MFNLLTEIFNLVINFNLSVFLPNYSLNKFIMKKRDLLLAGLFLFSVSAFAQDDDSGLGPNGETEPVRYSDDARIIFQQGFEGTADWDTIVLNTDPNRPTTLYTWDATPIDSITQMTYYKRNYQGGATDNPSGGTNIYNGDKQWEIAGVRDTVMYLYNGVMRTDAEQPEDSILGYDKHQISLHDAQSQSGTGDMGLDRFGEDGQNQYFTYLSAKGEGLINNAWSSGKVAEYRRNLFVRLNPGTIENYSSYRLTVFVRANSTVLNQDNKIDPAIGLELMRGYFHSEKPFMVENVGHETTTWWGAKTTEYYTFNDKTDYTLYPDADDAGKWQKITLMSYYNNDVVGDASAYLLSYYWNNDWDWNVEVDADGNVLPDGEEGTAAVLKFVKQPDKYFVRMSFRSDSTKFDVDNLSLTKSWIGGVEHYNDMIRVNFGYKTNMDELAEAALEKNKIAAVELPGQYFDVWMRYFYQGDTVWEYVPILSAEYHGDGYMYMWTKPYSNGSLRTFYPDDYVLVSFRNPVDNDSLRLVYNSNYYPNGLDSAWLANGKEVFDFHNEISSYNPTITVSNGRTVMSLKNLPPVVQELPYADGTFGLKNTDSLVFKFSRKVFSHNTGDKNTNTTFVSVTGDKGEEFWTITSYDGGRTVITRPESYKTLNGDLKGDYLIHFEQITHLEDAEPNNSDHYAENDVKLNLHFGTFEPQPATVLVAQSDWRAHISANNYAAVSGRPLSTNVYFHSAASEDTFRQGAGVSEGTKCGLYPLKDDTITVAGVKVPDNVLFYLSSRNTSSTGNLYAIEHLAAGKYSISFKFAGRSSVDYPMAFKFYAKPDGALENGNDKGFAVLEAVADKTVLEASRKPAANSDMGEGGTSKTWAETTETLSYTFVVPAEGDYVFEWVASGSSDYRGFALGNYWITTSGDLSFGPVSKLNEAIAAAQEKITLANNNPQYKGAAFEAVERVKAHGEGFIASINAANETATEDAGHNPADYTAETKMINDTIKAFNLQVDTVEAFFKALDDAQAKLDVYADSLSGYQELAAVQDLQNLVSSFNGYKCSIKAPGQINADTKALNDAVKAVDARQALNDKLNKAIDDAQDALNTYAATLSDNDLYTNLSEVLVIVSGEDPIDADNDEVQSMTNALNGARIALENYPLLAEVATKRILDLDVIAKALDASYGDDAELAAEIADRIANIDFDDDELANIQKAAITVALYDKLAAGEDVDSLDLTPFIKNYYLYATINGPVVENTDLQLPTARNEAKCKAENNPGSTIMHIKHEWGQDALNKTIWVLMYGQAFDDVFPGWTVESFITGNHSMVTPDDATDKYSNLSTGVNVFDGKLTMDWNSKAELKQSVVDLPVGIYTLGVNISSLDASSSVPTTLTAATSDTSVVFTKTSDGGVEAKCENIPVKDGKLDIDFILASNDGGSQADNFSLMFLGQDPSFNYVMAAESARSYLDNLITVVDFAEVEGAEYEYYTLNWIKVENPEKNQVYFRKSGNVVEKVIFK